MYTVSLDNVKSIGHTLGQVFQKPAQSPSIPHRGVLRPSDFTEDFQFVHHGPPAGLEHYIAYIWVISWDFAPDITRESLAVLPNPQVNVYFSNEGAGIQNIFRANHTYKASGSGCVAGITFQPGGFYAFWPHSISRLEREIVPISDIFGRADDHFAAELLKLPPDAIFRQLEALLLSRPPETDPNIEVLQRIIATIEQDQTLTTVDAVAKRFHKSERALQLLFQRYAGIGVKWVLLRKRVLYAVESARLQASPNWSAIAVDLGYSSQAHFITDFKRVVGMTPTEYLLFAA